jgi:drug/metabolite transporter (DMT)-like permease
LDHSSQPIASRRPARAPSIALIWAGILVLYFVWGSTYLGIRVAIDTIPPFVMAGVRFVIAGSVLLGWSALREGRSLVWPTAREWRDTAIVGALLLLGGMGLVSWGEQTVPSGIAALMVAMMPVWVAVLSWVFLRERLAPAAIVGIVVGIVGVGILVGPEGAPAENSDPTGVLALILSPISWAIGSLYSANRARLPSRPLVATGGQMLTGGILLSLVGLGTGEWAAFRPASVSIDSLVALAYLTVVGSLLAFTTYAWLLRVAPLPFIATYAYVNPVVAVILGTIILDEPLSPRTLVAGAVIVFAVALIITARGRMRAPARSQTSSRDDASGRSEVSAAPRGKPEPA